MAECLKTYNKSTLERRKVRTHTHIHTCTLTSTPSQSALCWQLSTFSFARSPPSTVWVLFQRSHDNDISPYTLSMWAWKRRTCACVKVRPCMSVGLLSLLSFHLGTQANTVPTILFPYAGGAFGHTTCSPSVTYKLSRGSSISVYTVHARRIACMAKRAHNRTEFSMMNQPIFVDESTTQFQWTEMEMEL